MTSTAGTSTQSALATPHHGTGAGGAALASTKDDIYIDDDALEGSGGHGGVSIRYLQMWLRGREIIRLGGCGSGGYGTGGNLRITRIRNECRKDERID